MQVVERCTAPDGSEIAYAVSGTGPLLVLPAWWVSDVEYDWIDPGWRQLFDLLGQHHTVVRYDRPGVGQSTRARNSFTIDDEVAYLRTVIDAVGGGPVSLLGQSCGGPPAIRLAAEQPDLVTRLVLYASYAFGNDLGPADTRTALADLVRSAWGTLGSRALADMFSPNATREQISEFARAQRRTATPDVAADLLQLTYDMDARDAAPHVKCPVLVLTRTGDRAIRPKCSRELAELMPTASLVELPGSDHGMNEGDSAALAREVERFLLGSSALDFATRELATVLFTDIINSTPQAANLGDEAWTMRLDEHDRISHAAVERFGGRVVKDTGDGILATFDMPTQALSCARELHRDLQRIGLQVRSGIHVGEVEIRGGDIAGITVNVAARVMGRAGAGETYVTSVVPTLSAGSGFHFEELAPTQLKGVDGDWILHQVADPTRPS